MKMVLTSSLLSATTAQMKTYLGTILLYGAVGTDDTTPSAVDTTLGAETLRKAREAFDTSATDTVVATTLITDAEENGTTLKETGWFLQNSGGTMYTRSTFTGIAKTSDITLYLDTSLKITVTEA